MTLKYLLFSFLLLPLFCVGQNNGCIDSVSFNKYYNQYFIGLSSKPAQRDVADNFYLNAGTKIGGNNYASILKFNANNQLLWYKGYRDRGTFFTDISASEITAIDNSANLFFTNFGQEITSLKYFSRLSKFDSSGNFIWGRRFERTDAPTVYGGLENDPGNIVANDGSIFYVHSTGDDVTRINIVKIDASGNISWCKKYGNIILPQFKILESKICYKEADTLVLFSHFFYNAAFPADINAKHGVQLVKINTTDGIIVSQNTIMYYNDVNSSQPNIITLQKLNYDKTRKQFLLHSDGQFAFPIINSHVIGLFDENLNVLKTNYFVAANFYPATQEDIRISEDNKLTITNRIALIWGPSTIIYATFDNNAELTAQRKVVLNSIGFPNIIYVSNVTFKKNGLLNFQLGLNSANYGGTAYPLFLFDHSPFYQGISNCLGYDTVVYKKTPIYTPSITGVTFNEFNGVPLQSTALFYTDPVVDLQMVKTELCKQVSICDTIKLLGTKYHCLSNPIDSFKIYRNPLCVRKTNWQVDTTAIKILSQNDTALYVQYLSSYSGKIKVGFGGCSLTDSIAIEVYNAKTGINLGNDTMHCPGKTITLYAGKGFKTYQWQNNTILDSLIATQAGRYHVSATDSCGNIFKDTIIIAPFDVVLKTDYPGRLCPADTVTFNLPTNLYNYSWTPTANSSLTSFTWRLFPPVTTTYSITGERLPGCTVSDTVLINVRRNCLPDYIYFPTAFTPDDNGKNDTYKPGTNGQFVFYDCIIYNRYGQTIYKTTDPAFGWDGRFNNSKTLPGTYVWVCKYQFVGRPVQQEQGSFVLIR